MKYIKSVFICIILLLVSIQAANWWLQVKAIDLTAENFSQHVGKEKHVIIEFFTPWCRYCQMLVTDYNKLFDYYQQGDTRNDVVIAKFNCESNQQFCQQHHIHSFPSIKYYPANEQVAQTQFHGNRVFDQMKTWIEQSCGEEKKPEQQQEQQQQQQQEQQQQNQEEQVQQISTQVNDDSQVLMKEIKKKLQDGLADIASVGNQGQKRNFHQMNVQDKAGMLFDEIHQVKLEMTKLNFMNKSNLDILHKVIGQADKLQDERIELQKQISKIDNEIDHRKNDILKIVTGGRKKKLVDIEKEVVRKRHRGEVEVKPMEHPIGNFLGALIGGAVFGYVVYVVIYKISGNKNYDDENGENDKLY